MDERAENFLQKKELEKIHKKNKDQRRFHSGKGTRRKLDASRLSVGRVQQTTKKKTSTKTKSKSKSNIKPAAPPKKKQRVPPFLRHRRKWSHRPRLDKDDFFTRIHEETDE
jgi:hypothetical protein